MIEASNISLRIGKKALFEEVNIRFTSKECFHLGITGAYAHYLVLAFEHPLQTIGAALFIFNNQYSHFASIIGIVTQ